MTEPQPEVEVIIPDHVMAQIEQLPPEAVDDLAEAISRIRENPAVGRPVSPHPVDHSPHRPHVHVPATRSVSYLRGAVAEISPQTVADFDQEMREEVRGDDPQERIHALRGFMLRWIEYIALNGDHAAARRIQEAPDREAAAGRLAETLEAIYARHFPDAADDPASLAIRVKQEGKGSWSAVCPITMLRVVRDTEGEARTGLDAALLRLISGF